MLLKQPKEVWSMHYYIICVHGKQVNNKGDGDLSQACTHLAENLGMEALSNQKGFKGHNTRWV